MLFRSGEPSRDRNGDPRMMDMMKMIGVFTNCLESFSRKFESPNSRTQFYKEITPNASDQSSKGPRNDKRNWAIEQSRGRDGDFGVMDVMKIIDAFTTCLASFSRRFEGHNTCTQSYRDITLNACDVWVKKGTHA